MIQSKTVSSISDYLRQIAEFQEEWTGKWEDRWENDDEQEWLPWFRGEPSVLIPSPLQPKLYRPKIRLSKLLHQEQELRLEFRRCAAQLILERHPADKWEFYFLMAHYGAPTRLLDWTDGALAALYFALRERIRRSDQFGLEEAAVYMLDPWWLNDLAFQEAQPRILASKRHSGVALPDWPAAKRYLPDEMKSEQLKPKRPMAIDPSHFARRLAAQRSRFVVFGRTTNGLTALAGRDDSALAKIPVAVSRAEEILHELKVSGISESMIFPDLDGLGRELDLVFQERCRIAFARSPSFRTPKRVRIEMRPSRVHKNGVGVFAASPISKNGFIASGIYEEDLRTQIPWRLNKSYSQVVQDKVRDFCIGSPKGFIPPEGFDFNSLSIEWYFNHSCDGNLGFNRDGDFVARRNIRRGEELTYDYGLAESNPRFKMNCSCGSAHCRRKISGSDWKNSVFREHNLNYMLPRLRRDPGKPNKDR